MTKQLDLDALQAAADEFDAFLNEPPSYEQERMVREYRHDAYPKWAKIERGLRDAIDRLRKAEAIANEAAEKALECATKYNTIVQAITDPENQPSQYGTVPMAMLRKAEAARDYWKADAEYREELLRKVDSLREVSAAPDSTPTDSEEKGFLPPRESLSMGFCKCFVDDDKPTCRHEGTCEEFRARFSTDSEGGER